MLNITLPKIDNDSLSDAKERRAIMEYLYNLTQELRHYKVSEEDLDKNLQKTVNGSETVAQGFERTIKDINGGMSKIIRTASELTSTIENTNDNVESQIQQLAASIATRVTQTVFNEALGEKADAAAVDALYESIVTQTAHDISFVFNILQGNISDVSGDFDSYKSELTTYLRILAAGILEMGRSDSPMTMQLSNTQLAFLQSGIVLAYFANNKMYVNEAEMETATIAGFKWEAVDGGTALRWVG